MEFAFDGGAQAKGGDVTLHLNGQPIGAGLYTLVVSLLVYALLGTSRHLSVGPTWASAALPASSVAGMVVMTASTDLADPRTRPTRRPSCS